VPDGAVVVEVVLLPVAVVPVEGATAVLVVAVAPLVVVTDDVVVVEPAIGAVVVHVAGEESELGLSVPTKPEYTGARVGGAEPYATV
jgi:hypothetical protein